MSDDLRRSDDKLMDVLIKTINDQHAENIEWQKAHDKKSDEWRLTIDDRFKPLEDLAKTLQVGWKVFLSIILALGSIWKAFMVWKHGGK